MRAGLLAAIDHARCSTDIARVVITGAGKTFVGGADIREFGKPMAEPSLPEVVDRDRGKPTSRSWPRSTARRSAAG